MGQPYDPTNPEHQNPPPEQPFPAQQPPPDQQPYPPPPPPPGAFGPPPSYGQQPSGPYGQQQPPPYPAVGNYPPGAGYPPAPGYAPPPPAGSYGELPPLPPGTELASAGRRIGTYLLDLVLAIVTLGIGYLIWSLIVWARGQTPGKQVMGMRVYHLESQRAAGWWRMVLGQVVGGFVNGILYIGWIVSFIFLFTDQLRRTVPDHMAGTIVLNDPDKRIPLHNG